MSETKRGPNGETIGIDGPQPRRYVRRWWAATDGIRLILLAGLLVVVGIGIMASAFTS